MDKNAGEASGGLRRREEQTGREENDFAGSFTGITQLGTILFT
jgi:hypothetical protein